MIIGLKLLSNYNYNILSEKNMIFIGIIIWILGNIGDLFFSYIKRLAKVKDSGKIMWLHGGMIDRFDSSLLSIPIIFLYLYVNQLL